VTVFERCADRSDNLTLEGKGLARGDGVCAGVPVKTVEGWETARFDGDKGDGESGDCGERIGDLSDTRWNLDGDRDSDRRRVLTAEVTST
jgi:hypothetical protein